MFIDFNKLDETYVVYKLLTEKRVTIYVGYEKLRNVFRFSKILRNSSFDLSKPLKFEMVAIYDNREAAKSEAIKTRRYFYARLYREKALSQYTLVRCVETGKIYKNIATVCRCEGLQTGNMSMHLAGKTGYKTVKGKTYVRECYLDEFNQPRVSLEEIIV